jgi:sugar/nucleoside kinase (ribokinase family)
MPPILSSELANFFEPAEITLEMRAAVRAADLVHVAGYVLLQPSRREAVLGLMQEAQVAGAAVALDLVPHDLFRYLDGAELLSSLRPLVTWLVVELGTAQGVLGHERTTPDRPEAVEKAMEALVLKFPSVVLYLGSWRALVQDRGERWEETFDYAPGAASRGHTARSQARLLHQSLRRA